MTLEKRNKLRGYVDGSLPNRIQLHSLSVTGISVLFHNVWGFRGFIEFLLREYSEQSKEMDRYVER
jgi:hypothetical protein